MMHACLCIYASLSDSVNVQESAIPGFWNMSERGTGNVSDNIILHEAPTVREVQW